MPTYEEYEESVASSAPLEGYKFIGTFKTYRYTSSERSQLIGGELYLPLAITRSRIKSGTHEDDNLSLDLEIPFDTDVVQDYAYAQTPPKLLLEVYRFQQDDPEEDAYALFWTGRVRGFTITGRVAKVEVPSIFSLALQGEIPSVYYQAPCNHVLYDQRCGLTAANYKYDAVVQAIAPLTITLTGSPTTTGELDGGEIVNTRNGERRLIQHNAGPQIELNFAFVDILVGDNVQVDKGCDHSFTTCKAKFANGINFGGDPYIPPDNPFEGELG